MREENIHMMTKLFFGNYICTHICVFWGLTLQESQEGSWRELMANPSALRLEECILAIPWRSRRSMAQRESESTDCLDADDKIHKMQAALSNWNWTPKFPCQGLQWNSMHFEAPNSLRWHLSAIMHDKEIGVVTQWMNSLDTPSQVSMQVIQPKE